MIIEIPNPKHTPESTTVARFAFKCFGHRLSILQSIRIVKMARGNIHASTGMSGYMNSVMKSIAWAYRDVMDV